MIYLKDKDISIRDIIESDIVSLFQWWVDKEINQHDPRPLPSNSYELMKECENFCKRFCAEVMIPNEAERKYKYFIITDSNNQPIGSINFFSIDKEKRQGEMGIVIGDKRYWQKGIAKIAAKVATDYIFDNMDIRRIYIETGETNIPALRLFEKLGFRKCDEILDEGFKFIAMELIK